MVQNVLIEANLFLAIQLQPDLIIIRAILQVASILRKIKVEVKPKILLLRDNDDSSKIFQNKPWPVIHILKNIPT